MPRENQKEEATPAIPGGDAFFAGIPMQMELKGFGKSKMKHHNFEQTSLAKNVCVWIQHAQSLLFFSNWNFGRFNRENTAQNTCVSQNVDVHISCATFADSRSHTRAGARGACRSVSWIFEGWNELGGEKICFFWWGSGSGSVDGSEIWCL